MAKQHYRCHRAAETSNSRRICRIEFPDTTGGSLFDFFIRLPVQLGDIDTTAIDAPPGWGDSAGGQVFSGSDTSPATSFIEWAADFSGRFDLAIGDSLSGFSFASRQAVPPPIPFALDGSTAFQTAVQVPTEVPEPGMFAPLAMAVIFLRWSRRHFHMSRS
jgi:hypothetical protein